MKKYFITGRGGFIGTNIVSYISKFNDCKICDEMDSGCTVIHLAAYGNHYYQQDANKIIKANITSLVELVDKALKIKVEKFYNISSSSVTLLKQTMYSASKMFGETFIESLGDEKFVNIRPYSVYGEGEASHRLIPTIIRSLNSGEKMLLDINATHDWIHVTDFINAMFSGYKNIGTGQSLTNMQIVKILEKVSGNKLNFDVAKLRTFDNNNWVCEKGVPHMNIYDRLKQVYEYYTNS